VSDEREESRLEEPTLKPKPTRLERRVEPSLLRAASIFGSIVALVLLALVAIALVGTVRVVALALIARDFNRAVVDGLDSAFLVIILLELVHTTLARGPVSSQLQAFLVVGITAGVRLGLEVAAERGDPAAVVRNLAINALGVLVLVGALWLVRERLHAERTAQR
jgi:phosphate starvation-inducible membrane PsiE